MINRREALKSMIYAGVSSTAISWLPRLDAKSGSAVVRSARPRLYHPADDLEYRFAPPTDPLRKRILENILADCKELSNRQVWEQIPEVPNSPLPFHQLYITFYTAMQATALIEQYAFAWRMTHDERWLAKAKQWLLASVRWKHTDQMEEYFYVVDRYMEAYALALDWLDGGLTTKEQAEVEQCLIGLMNRWWPDVNKQRHDPEGGNHAAVDNAHFGMAALQLVGAHPQATEWVTAVADRFRAAIMPNGCGKDGEPCDGISFWADENIWVLQFCDALRNVMGIDLYKEFPERVSKPLVWARYCLAPPQTISDVRYAQENTTCLTGTNYDQLDSYSAGLLRLAQDAGDDKLREIALRDPLLGRVHLYGYGVKNSDAECMVAWGPFAYLYCDPSFKSTRKEFSHPLHKSFTPSYGTVTFLRSSWAEQNLAVQLLGYSGHGGAAYSNFHIQYAGYPVLKAIGAAESVPVSCGSFPCVGGQDEFLGLIGDIQPTSIGVKVAVEGRRTRQEFWMLTGDNQALVVALRRKARGVELAKEEGHSYARLNGEEYLQFPRERYFNPSAGELRVKVRLHDKVTEKRPQIIFNTGMGISGTGLGTGVNQFNLGFWKEEGLTFGVTSQDFLHQHVTIGLGAAMEPGRWHELVARWGGFNKSGDKPFIELELDGHRKRFDDQVAFGEMNVDTEGLKSRTTPMPFYITPRTELAFGGAIQIPGTGISCDLGRIELVCPERDKLIVDFENGMGNETGSGLLEWLLNPVEWRERKAHSAVFGAGPQRMNVEPLLPRDPDFREEAVPFTHSGLASGSIKLFREGSEDPSARLRVGTPGNELVLLFVDQRIRTEVRPLTDGFELTLNGSKQVFDLTREGTNILKVRA